MWYLLAYCGVAALAGVLSAYTYRRSASLPFRGRRLAAYRWTGALMIASGPIAFVALSALSGLWWFAGLVVVVFGGGVAAPAMISLVAARVGRGRVGT